MKKLCALILVAISESKIIEPMAGFTGRRSGERKLLCGFLAFRCQDDNIKKPFEFKNGRKI
jgi:hypothetical protein